MYLVVNVDNNLQMVFVKEFPKVKQICGENVVVGVWNLSKLKFCNLSMLEL